MNADGIPEFKVEQCSHEVLLTHAAAIHQGRPERFTLPCCFRAEGDEKTHALLIRDDETIAVGSSARNGSGARLITSRLDRPKPDCTELAALIDLLGGPGELVLEQALEHTAHQVTSALSGIRLQTRFQLTLYRFDGPPGTRPHSDESVRTATESDIPLLADWLHAFGAETGYRHPGSDPDFRLIAQRNINSCAVSLLEIDGIPVALGQRARQSTIGQNRIGLVFVPRKHRGQGHARRLVRSLVESVLAEGAVPCLFADRKNMITNRLYESLSFVESDSLVHLEPTHS